MRQSTIVARIGAFASALFITACAPTPNTELAPAWRSPLWSDVAPVVSPEGDWIAFASTRSGISQVFVMRPDASGLRQLTKWSESGYATSWAADGRRLLNTTA